MPQADASVHASVYSQVYDTAFRAFMTVVEQNIMPDFVLRAGIRRLLSLRKQESVGAMFRELGSCRLARSPSDKHVSVGGALQMVDGETHFERLQLQPWLSQQSRKKKFGIQCGLQGFLWFVRCKKPCWHPMDHW